VPLRVGDALSAPFTRIVGKVVPGLLQPWELSACIVASVGDALAFGCSFGLLWLQGCGISSERDGGYRNGGGLRGSGGVEGAAGGRDRGGNKR